MLSTHHILDSVLEEEAGYAEFYFALIFLTSSIEILVHYTANDRCLLLPFSFIACRYPAISRYKTSLKTMFIIKKMSLIF